MNRLRLFALSLCICLPSTLVVAQDPLDEIYGQGVHAYFTGNLEAAHDLFTQAIDSGSVDPRVFYFRGLTQAKQSGAGAGLADYEQGAQYEISGRKVVNIGKSLERVQGALRVELEKTRQQARLQARAQQAVIQREQLEKLQKSGGAPVGPTGVDPFAGGSMEGEPKEQPKETTEVPAVEEGGMGGETEEADPFKDDDAAGDAPASDDAMGDEPAGDEPASGDDDIFN